MSAEKAERTPERPAMPSAEEQPAAKRKATPAAVSVFRPRVAIIGDQRAGKASLLNRILETRRIPVDEPQKFPCEIVHAEKPAAPSGGGGGDNPDARRAIEVRFPAPMPKDVIFVLFPPVHKVVESGAMLDELSKCTKMFFLTQHDTRILSNSWIHLMLATLARRCPAVFKTIHVVYTKMDSLILGSLDRDIDTVKSHFVDAAAKVIKGGWQDSFCLKPDREKMKELGFARGDLDAIVGKDVAHFTDCHGAGVAELRACMCADAPAAK